MKEKQHAKDRREAGKRDWRMKPVPSEAACVVRQPALSKEEQAAMETEETRQFLACLENMHVTDKDSAQTMSRRKAGIPVINLEDGMPTVEEALVHMKAELQVMKRNHVRVTKLIHGYGSTGKGGKIRIGVRRELAAMKEKRFIQGFITGEDFGPFSGNCRSVVDQDKTIAKDPDYGRCNQGITIVII